MNNMLQSAIAVLASSAAALIWGIQYRADHPLAPLGALFGAEDPTYTTAGWAAGLGTLGFFVGSALLIAGLMQTNTTAHAPTQPPLPTPQPTPAETSRQPQ